VEINVESKSQGDNDIKPTQILVNGRMYTSIEANHDRIIAKKPLQEISIRNSQIVAYEHTEEEESKTLLVGGLLFIVLGAVLLIIYVGIALIIFGIILIMVYASSKGSVLAEIHLYTTGGQFKIRSSIQLIEKIRSSIE